jgi:ABC-2 type transport system ATP-binding protein
VSDSVAILNRGKLVANAPIQELLNGNGSAAIYSVTIQGDTRQAQARLAGRSWIQSLSTETNDGLTSWQVSVIDDEAAEDEMLRLILQDRSVRVKSFGRKTYNLEEVFLNLVGEEKSK